MTRTAKLRIGGGLAAAVLLAGGGAGWRWHAGADARLAAQVRSGPDADRLAAAKALAARPDAQPVLRDLLQTGDEETCHAVAAAFGDPLDADLGGLLLDAFPHCGEPGRLAILDLLPAVLAGSPPEVADRCRDVVTAALGGSGPVACRGVRLAMRPDVAMKGAVVPALRHPDAGVRREAMAAVGPPMPGEPVVGDEELFAWLHDPDDGVRLVCEAALAARGVEPEQVEGAKKLTHPDAAERLKLLVELRAGTGGLGEPGPWLERLARDPEPAVRAGAARVACERRLPFAGWVRRLATDDPDAGVRQVAAFHRGRMELQPAGFAGE